MENDMNLRDILANEFDATEETGYSAAVRAGGAKDDTIIRAALAAMAKVQGWDGHDSDCGTHNMPAEPNGPCDCSISAPAN